MCGAWVRMRRCSSASFGSGTTMKRISWAISSDELRNPKSGAARLGGRADCDVPLRLGKRKMKRTAAEINFIGLLFGLILVRAMALRLWNKQHPAANLPLFERSMGLSSIGERVGAINPDGKLPLPYPGDELLQVMRVLLEIGEAIRAREKQRAFFLERHQVERRNVSTRLPVDHQVTSESKAIEARRKCVFPNPVIDNVHPATLGNASGFLGNISLSGNDYLIGAGLSHKFLFLLARGHADHPSLANLCHLTEQEPNPSCSFFQAQTIGYGDQSRSWDQGMGGVGIPYEADTLSRLNMADLGTDRFHNSNSLTSESCREI